MENLYANKNSSKSYYVQKKKDFDRLHEIMHLLPSYALYEKGKEEFTDIYLETSDDFLKNMGVTVRLRRFKDKQVVSVKYNEKIVKTKETIRKSVYEQVLESSESVFSHENLLFIEDKLNVIFGGKLQIDILYKLRQLQEVYLVKTLRKSFEAVHNSGFRADIFFDEVVYVNKLKTIDYKDLILQVRMTSLSTDLNKKLFENYINELRKKIVLVPMKESKYEAAVLYTRFK
jgi:hypothetical protein